MKKPSNIKAPPKGKTAQDRLAPISKISDEHLHREYIEYLYQDFRDDPSETIHSFIGRDSIQIIQNTIDLFASDIDEAVLKRLRKDLVDELNESLGEDDSLDSWDTAIAKNEDAYLKSGSTPVERIGSNITTSSRTKLFSKYLSLLAHACSHMSSDKYIKDHLCNLFSNNRYTAKHRLLQCRVQKDVGEVLAGFIRKKCTTTKQTSFSRAETNKINEDFDKRFPNKGDYTMQKLVVKFSDESKSKKIDDIWIEITWVDSNFTKRLGKKNAVVFLALIDNHLKNTEVGLSSVIVAKLYERYGLHLADDKMDKDTQTTLSHLRGKKEGALKIFNNLFEISDKKMDWKLVFKKRVTIQCDNDMLKTIVGPHRFKTSH